MAHHLIAFELIIHLLYINFPSLQSKTFLKDVKSTLLSSVALSFRNLGNVVFVWDSTASVPDQIGTVSQVGTKQISKGGWTI